jgi:site-specific recombinase XerD
MIEIKGLTLEQNKKFQFAIEQGYFDDYVANPRKWKHTFCGAFLWKNPRRVKTLADFEEVIGHKPEWEDVTDDNLRDLVDEMLESGKTPSSVKTMCAEVKAVINANKKKVKSDDFQKILSVKGQATRHVYITQEEMERLMEYHPRTYAEEFVLRTFLISMMTGARVIDAQKMTINNCNMETNMLSYIPKKTPGIVVSVPVDERHNLRKFLSIGRKHPCCLDVYNETIRNICRYCGMEELSQATKNGRDVVKPKWELVSSHTARRSFATNLYLAGVALEDIAVMMGHGKNIETTKRYICAERQVSQNVMAYFQPQEMAY